MNLDNLADHVNFLRKWDVYIQKQVTFLNKFLNNVHIM